MATPGTAFEGTWHARKFLENAELTRALGWRSTPDLKLLTTSANEYAKAQLAVHARFAEAANLPTLQATVERLKSAAEMTASSPLSCLACIGWGGVHRRPSQ